METVYVYFSTVMEVKRFVENISPLEGDFDLIDGRYVVDARSLMGIFGMNLMKPIQLRIHKNSKKAMQAIKSFIVEEPVATPGTATPGTTAPGTAAPLTRVILEDI